MDSTAAATGRVKGLIPERRHELVHPGIYPWLPMDDLFHGGAVENVDPKFHRIHWG